MVLADVSARFQRLRAQEPFWSWGLDAFPPAPTPTSGGPAADPVARLAESRVALHLHELPPPVVVSDPACYRFTQWIFLQLVARDLVRRELMTVDICDGCHRELPRGLVAACPRCGGALHEREVARWMMDVRPYAEALHRRLESASHGRQGARGSRAERALLGRRPGHEVSFPASTAFRGEYEELTAFTQRIETIYGVTFILVDPYHPILKDVLDPFYEEDLQRYRERLRKGAEPRVSAVRTGGFGLNPANLRRVPILASPLARNDWSDGVVLGVPAHDRDHFELARRMKLQVREVITGEHSRYDAQLRLETPWLGDGVLTNSGPFTSQPIRVGRERIAAYLERKGAARETSRFRLRRLRVSSPSRIGPPVPMVHCSKCGTSPLPESALPVELPGPPTGEPTRPGVDARPVADSPRSSMRTPCPRCGRGAERDGQMLRSWLTNAWFHLLSLAPSMKGEVEGFRSLTAPPPPEAAAPPEEAPGLEPEGAERDWIAEEAIEIEAAREAARGMEAAAPEGPRGAPGAPMEEAAGPGPGPEGSLTEGRPQAVPEPEPHRGEEELETGARPAIHPEPLPGPVAGDDEEAGKLEGKEAAGGPLDAAKGEARAARSGRGERQGDGGGRQGQRSRASAVDPETDIDIRMLEEEPDEPTWSLSRLRPFAPALQTGYLPADALYVPCSVPERDLEGARTLGHFLAEAGHLGSPDLSARVVRVGPLVVEPRTPRSPSAAKPSIEAVAATSEGQRVRTPVPWPCGPEGPGARFLPELVERFGADAVRIHLLAAGPIDAEAPLRFGALLGVARFLDRLWRQITHRIEHGKFMSRLMLERKHKLIHRVTERLAAGKAHTAVAAFMEFVNFLEHRETPPEDMDRAAIRTFVILLSPFAPFLARELWSRLGETEPLSAARWPVASDELIHPPEQEYMILIDGKVRDRMVQPSQLEVEKLESRALQRDRVRELVGTRKVARVVVVPRRLVSIALEPLPS